MLTRILLVNPPIYDFSAYDFWLKPYGLLTIGGFLQNNASLDFFDFLDRLHPVVPISKNLDSDQWHRGHFLSEEIPKPAALASIPRRYHRLGLPRNIFQNWLSEKAPFDFALVQTTMTYWYLGVKEVIEDIRKICPNTKIAVGGVYATICPEHTKSLGADLVIKGSDLGALWKFLNINPSQSDLPFWQAYPKLESAVLKLTDGCPFKCSYCSVPQTCPEFTARPLSRVTAEFDYLNSRGVKDIAFYDDALLFDSEHILVPFLEHVIRKNAKINFHTPNALHARLLSEKVADILVRGGFKTFYLGFESSEIDWQKQTGGKISADEFETAVKNLLAAGAEAKNITAYILLGHPLSKISEVEESMRFVNGLGIRIMLAEFSPIPNTPDGRLCEKLVDLNEPLLHNKTAFPILLLGNDKVNRLKDLCRRLNAGL